MADDINHKPWVDVVAPLVQRLQAGYLAGVTLEVSPDLCKLYSEIMHDMAVCLDLRAKRARFGFIVGLALGIIMGVFT